MAEETKKRPWWMRKTELGVCLMLAGAVMQFIPVTAPVAGAVMNAGAILAGAGVVHRNLKGEAK